MALTAGAAAAAALGKVHEAAVHSREDPLQGGRLAAVKQVIAPPDRTLLSLVGLQVLLPGLAHACQAASLVDVTAASGLHSRAVSQARTGEGKAERRQSVGPAC